MSFSFVGLNNFNMYGIANYNMFGGCCNPFARMAVANMVYNPFMVFNTAQQLMNGNFPSFNMNFNNFGYSSMPFMYSAMPYMALPQIGHYPMPQGSLYDNLYYSNFYVPQIAPVNYSMQPSVAVQNSFDFDTDDIWSDMGVDLTRSTTNTKTKQNLSPDSTSKEPVQEAKIDKPSVVKEKKKVKYQPIYEQIAGAHLNQEFLNKTKQVAKNIGCDFEDLLAVMNSESTLNPKNEHKNKNGQVTAVGLIQFTKDYAIPDLNRHFGLDLTVEKIKKMSAIEQLDLVQKYYEMNKNKLPKDREITAADLYAVTYLPARASRDVLSVRGEDYYNSNRGLDMNFDGKITKDDLEQRLSQKRVRLSTFA